jgi:hypothetical protein
MTTLADLSAIAACYGAVVGLVRVIERATLTTGDLVKADPDAISTDASRLATASYALRSLAVAGALPVPQPCRAFHLAARYYGRVLVDSCEATLMGDLLALSVAQADEKQSRALMRAEAARLQQTYQLPLVTEWTRSSAASLSELEPEPAPHLTVEQAPFETLDSLRVRRGEHDLGGLAGEPGASVALGDSGQEPQS